MSYNTGGGVTEILTDAGGNGIAFVDHADADKLAIAANIVWDGEYEIPSSTMLTVNILPEGFAITITGGPALTEVDISYVYNPRR